MKRPGLPALVSLLIGLSLLLWFDAPSVYSQDEEPNFVPGQLLIAFKPGLSQAEINNFYAEYGLAEKEDLDVNAADDNPGIKLVGIPAEINAELIATLESDPRIRYAEPNYLLSVQRDPDDSNWAQLWGLHNTGQTGGTADADIDAPETWEFATGSSDVIVGIIDTGVDYTHEDLKDNIWVNTKECPQGYGKCEANGRDDDANGYVDDFHGVNTITDVGDPMDDYGHGSHTAGTIGASGNNRLGVSGINWKVKIVGCKFLSAFGSGTTANAIKCFNYFTELKTKQGYNIVVTNNSWGGGQFNEALRDAMAGDDAPLHICAAGNSNSGSTHYPAGYDLPNIISVAATDHDDRYANFSNWGKDWVDLAAPGVDILSTVPVERCPLCDPSGYREASGTSMATPHVAGAAALIFSQYPDLTNEQVKGRIMSGGDVLSDRSKETLTNTRLNLLNAMEDDQVPPAAVSDLKASGVLLTQVNLTWTATGDDGNTGTANAYDIRYSTAPISDATWESATQVSDEPKPQPAGNQESITVSDLSPNTPYYVAIRVHDNAGNASDLSNIVIVRTSGGTVVFEDDMENGPDKWTIDGEDNLWHLSQRRANSPVTAWYYGDETKGNYDTGEANRGSITSVAIDITAADDAILVFSEWSELQDSSGFDVTRVQVSTDGRSFQEIFQSHGTDNKWERRMVSLAPYLTESGIVHVRFHFDTVNDRFNEFEGWYIDDVQVLTAKIVAPGLGAPQPNLVMHESNIGVNPIHPVAGDRLRIYATVLNNGMADAGDVLVQFLDVTNADAPMPIGRPQTIGSIPMGGSGTAEAVYDTAASGGRVGSRDIRIVVDPNNFIAEGNEADNGATRVVTIGEPPAPNLNVQINNIGFDPAEPSAGDQVTIRATILNNGSVEAEDVVIQFLDATETRAVPIGEPQTIDVIPAGGSGVVQVTLDTTGVTDDRKVEVIADPNNVIAESDEDDNDATKTLQMISFAAPNLLVDATNIGFNPISPIEGDTVTIIATIINDGDVDATDVLVQFVDTTDNSGTPIGQQQTIESIPAGSSATAQVEYATSGKSGDRKIEVRVDPHNFIQESKETDNQAKGTLTVALPPAPNLIMQDENIGFNPAAPTEGASVTINATVRNGGNEAATDVIVQFVDVSGGGSTPIGERQTIDSIPAGGSATASVAYPTAGKAGDRSVQVVVDPSNFIAESDETDNSGRATLSVALPPAPNLVIQPNNIEFSPSEPVEGDRVSITAVVLNNGTTDARNVLVQFIDLTTGAAIPIGKEQTLALVPMGGSASAQVTLDLAGFSRDRKIQVLVDSNNLIDEVSENDNEATKVLRISGASAPNLVIGVDNIGFNPPNPLVGDAVTIQAVIRNNGEEDASEVLVQFVDLTSGRPMPIGQPQVIDLIPVGGSGAVEVDFNGMRTSGAYRIQVVVDPNNFIRESNETDNKATQTLIISPPPASNLTVHEANIGFAPPTPVEGDRISVTVTILNNGAVAAQDILVQFVDITDGGMTPIDEKKTIDEIPVGGSGIAQVTYDTTDRVGERKIQVLVDPHSMILEEDESDNVAVRTLVVAPAPAPNLTVLDSNIGFDPNSPVEGDTVVIHVTVLNTGSDDVADVAVQFIDVTDDGATPIGTNQMIASIPAGGSASAQVEYETTGKAGDRKIQIIADRNNLIPETDEGDNEAQETLTVASPSAPNLVLKSTNIGLNPTTPNAGDQVTIIATVRNDGDMDASNVVVQFTDATEGSAPIGQPQTIDGIPAGGSAIAQVTYDTTGKGGDRKIEVVVDPNNFIRESKETDNEATKTLKMISSPTPNLVLKTENVGFNPTAPRAGEQVVIRAVVVNIGSAEATDVVVQFVDVTDSGAPKPIGQPQTIDDIAAGSSGVAQVVYSTQGMSVVEGENERTIEVKVDPNNFIPETSESDNTAKVTLELAAASAPNLVMLANNVGFNPPTPIEDDPVIIHAVVLNDGAQDASDIVVQFVDTSDGESTPIGRPQLITRIAAGSSGSAQVAYDTRGKAGERRIQVVVDPNNFVPESDEGDNRTVATLPVSPPPMPNLTILGGNIKFDPANPGQGDTVTIAVTVLNNGTADASDVVVQIADATNGDDPLPIGAEQLIDFIPAGGSGTVEVLFNETDEAGDRRIQVTVDPSDAVGESDEDDNVATKTLTISPPLIPNLVVGADDIVFDPTNPTAGDRVTVTVTIRNDGNTPAENVAVEISDVTNGSEPIDEIDPIPSIRGGGSAEVTVFYDTTDKAGTRRIQVTIDPDNAIGETNENDNRAVKNLRVASEEEEPVDLPNIVILSGNIKFDPAAPSAGDPVTITVNVLNMGQQDAEDVAIRFVDITDGGEDEIGEKTITDTIAAGDSAEITMTYDTTDKVGERIIQVIGDPDDAIEESNEEDNSADKTLTVSEPASTSASADSADSASADAGSSASTPATTANEETASVTADAVFLTQPNLVVTARDIALIPSGSGPLTIAVNVANDGSEDAIDVVVQFLDVTANGLIAVGDPQYIESIPAGSSQLVATVYSAIETAGDHEFQVVVDPDNTITEVNETDNLAGKAVYIIDPQAGAEEVGPAVVGERE